MRVYCNKDCVSIYADWIGRVDNNGRVIEFLPHINRVFSVPNGEYAIGEMVCFPIEIVMRVEVRDGRIILKGTHLQVKEKVVEASNPGCLS